MRVCILQFSFDFDFFLTYFTLILSFSYLVPRILVQQMEADGAQGYDFVAYHGYGKRRYFELVDRKCVCSNL